MKTARAWPSRWHEPGEGTLLAIPPFAWRLIGVQVKKSDPRIALLREALGDVDPIGDAVVEWMKGGSAGERRGRFEHALMHGVASIDTGSPLGALFADVERIPAWLDRAKLRLGAETMLRLGRGGTYALGSVSLMSGYLASGAVKPLAKTGALTSAAPRRLAATGKFTRDLATSGDLARSSDGFKTTVRVRLLHAMVRAGLTASPSWKNEDWGAPINQRDLVGTHLEFTIGMISGTMALGYFISGRERDALMHLWRYVGLLLGIRDDLLPKTFQEGLEVAWIFDRTEEGPDADSRALGSALIAAFIARGKDEDARAFAELESRFLCGFSRFALGARAADALGIPDDLWKYAPLALAPGRAALEVWRRLVPGGRERAIRRGRSALESDLAHALGGRTPEFQPYGLREG